MRKMERAENSDLDTSLATVNMRNIFREKKFRRKVPFKYANWRTQLGKEIGQHLEPFSLDHHTHAPPPTSSLPTTCCHSSLGSLDCLAALADGTSRWSFERRPRGQLATRQQRACSAGKPAQRRARPLALRTPAAGMCFWPTRLHRQHLASFARWSR